MRVLWSSIVVEFSSKFYLWLPHYRKLQVQEFVMFTGTLLLTMVVYKRLNRQPVVW